MKRISKNVVHMQAVAFKIHITQNTLLKNEATRPTVYI